MYRKNLCLILLLLFLHLQAFVSAQNVGVGIITPLGKLHIMGSADIPQLIIDANITQSNTNPIIKLRKSSGIDLMWIHSDDSTNCFVGMKAGSSNVIGPQGINNTFLGSRSGYANTNGRDNTVVGKEAFFSNTKASQNVAIGARALYTQSFAPGAAWYQSNNVAVGFEALFTNQPTSTNSGVSNTAVGAYGLHANTTGTQNVAMGTFALYLNTLGNANTAIGCSALNSNTTGVNNAATGYFSLFSNTIGIKNTSMGSNSLFYNVAGSNATAVGNDAMLYTNNTTTAFENVNVALGFEALRGSTTPANNTGLYNTALGYQVLVNNTSGSNNTIAGHQAVFDNKVGSYNTVLGSQAMWFNHAGSKATAIGYRAMYYTNNTDTPFDNFNLAVGYEALRGSDYAPGNTGNYNLAVGYQALYFNSTAQFNTAIGWKALHSNTIGFGNTAFGHNSMYNNVSGDYNIAIGDESSLDFDASNRNIIIGAYGRIAATNSIALGYSAYINVDNIAQLGITTTVQCGGYANWSNFSDGRFKKAVQENVKGLDFILRLRPVTYHMDVRGLHDFWGVSVYGVKDSLLTADMKSEIDQAIQLKEGITMSGFIAQEVEVAAQESGYDFDGVIKPVHDKDHYSLAYGEFVVPLTKAIQEMSMQISQQDSLIHQMKSENEALLRRIEKLEAISSKGKYN